MTRSGAAALAIGLAALQGLAALPAVAVQPDEILADRALEQRARAISGDLRCLVCQNQSIDDSDAPLAHDLRVLVRERLTRGDSDDAVRRYVVSRYGEYVLLRPVLAWHTLLLWWGPALLLGAGLVAAVAAYRAGAGREAPPLNEAERNRLGEILARDGG